MTEIKKFTKGDYSAIYCEVWVNDEYFGDVRTEYADKFINLLNELIDENKELKEDYEYLEKRFREEEWHYNHIDEDRDVWRYKCNQLEKENKQLKAQLYCPFDSICVQCQYEYLVHTGDKYYVSKCRKGHEECSKVDMKYCDDFKLKGDVE